MNNEIKEILFLLHNDRLTVSGKRKLEDYITNLQEENERLKHNDQTNIKWHLELVQENEKLKEENKQLKKKIKIEWLSDEGKYQYAIDCIVLEMDKLEERIDKVIEYIQNRIEDINNGGNEHDYRNLNEILNILQGSDKERWK